MLENVSFSQQKLKRFIWFFFLQTERIPAYFTDYCQYSCECAKIAVEGLGIGTISSVRINPFRSPIRKLAEENDMPWYSNGFFYNVIYPGKTDWKWPKEVWQPNAVIDYITYFCWTRLTVEPLISLSLSSWSGLFHLRIWSEPLFHILGVPVRTQHRMTNNADLALRL